MKFFLILMFSALTACSTPKKNTIQVISPSIEKKLVRLWENRSNQDELEKELSIKLLQVKDQQFEYTNDMNKVFVEFSDENKKLIRIVFISYELNPDELKKLIPCQWKENSKTVLAGKQKIELKEYLCDDKKILIKNNQQSYSLWEAWFGV